MLGLFLTEPPPGFSQGEAQKQVPGAEFERTNGAFTKPVETPLDSSRGVSAGLVNSKNIDKLIEEAWEIECEDARSAGAFGFTLPTQGASAGRRKAAAFGGGRCGERSELSPGGPGGVLRGFGSGARFVAGFKSKKL